MECLQTIFVTSPTSICSLCFDTPLKKKKKIVVQNSFVCSSQVAKRTRQEKTVHAEVSCKALQYLDLILLGYLRLPVHRSIYNQHNTFSVSLFMLRI